MTTTVYFPSVHAILPKKSSTLNWPGRSFWSAGIFSTIGLDQGIGADYMNIYIYTHMYSYIYIYIYIWIDVLHGGKKKRKSCHHLEISHDFPVVFWGSCTDWPVPPPVATCYSQDAADSWWRSRWAQGLYHHRLLEDQWREKNPKNVEEEGANKQQAADLAKYECSDMLGPSLSDRSEGFSLHTKFVCVKALLFGHGGFSVLCMRTNPHKPAGSQQQKIPFCMRRWEDVHICCVDSALMFHNYGKSPFLMGKSVNPLFL